MQPRTVRKLAVNLRAGDKLFHDSPRREFFDAPVTEVIESAPEGHQQRVRHQNVRGQEFTEYRDPLEPYAVLDEAKRDA